MPADPPVDDAVGPLPKPEPLHPDEGFDPAEVLEDEDYAPEEPDDPQPDTAAETVPDASHGKVLDAKLPDTPLVPVPDEERF